MICGIPRVIVRFAEKFSLTHPALALVTLPMAVMLWSTNSYQFNFRTITDFCASAFSFWTILLLVPLLVKVPKIFYLAGALYLAILGTITLTIHQPFFSFPTLVHLSEAIFGFGYLSSFFKNKKRFLFSAGVVLVLFSSYLFYQSKESCPAIPEENAPEQQEGISVSSGKSVCGNDMCEPNLGEIKESCPKDCSAGD